MERGIIRHEKVSFSLGFPITFKKPITSENASLDYSVFRENEPHAEYISRTNLDFHINALSDGQVRTTWGIPWSRYITHIFTVTEASRNLTSKYFSSKTGNAKISAGNTIGKPGIQFSAQTPQIHKKLQQKNATKTKPNQTNLKNQNQTRQTQPHPPLGNNQLASSLAGLKSDW